MVVLTRMILAITCASLMFVLNWSGGHGLEEEVSQVKFPDPEPTTQITPPVFEMDSAINTVESLFLLIEQSDQRGEIQLRDTEPLNRIIKITKEITEAVKDSKNALYFLKANGLIRIVAPNLANQYPEVKTQLILLLKVLFDTAPTTTHAFIPTKILTNLIDIFENDNLGLKAYALDVLAKWIPDNPRIQTRIIKLKGLEAFYNQIRKLDMSGVKNVLDLFNTILKEHLAVKNAYRRTNIGGEKYQMYQKIGLVERMSTPPVCNALLNIFEILWSFNNNENHEVEETLLNLFQNIEPTCMNMCRGRSKTLTLYETFLDYVTNENKQEILNKVKLNKIESQAKLEKCVTIIKSYRDDL